MVVVEAIVPVTMPLVMKVVVVVVVPLLLPPPMPHGRDHREEAPSHPTPALYAQTMTLERIKQENQKREGEQQAIKKPTGSEEGTPKATRVARTSSEECREMGLGPGDSKSRQNPWHRLHW